MASEREQRLEEALRVALRDLEAIQGCDTTGFDRSYLAKAIAYVRNSLEATPATPSGWQPIETAPRDGTPFISISTHGVHETFWECVDGGGHPENGPAIYWWTSPTTEFIDGPYDAPFGWMPLPPAPAQVAPQEQEKNDG